MLLSVIISTGKLSITMSSSAKMAQGDSVVKFRMAPVMMT